MLRHRHRERDRGHRRRLEGRRRHGGRHGGRHRGREGGGRLLLLQGLEQLVALDGARARERDDGLLQRLQPLVRGAAILEPLQQLRLELGVRAESTVDLREESLSSGREV